MSVSLLKRFTSSYKFRSLNAQQRAIELHDFKWQEKNFKPFQKCENYALGGTEDV